MSSEATGINFVFLALFSKTGSCWPAFYESQKILVSAKNLFNCSTQEKSHLHHFWVNNPFKNVLMDLFIKNTQFLLHKLLTGVVWITCGLLFCFYQLLGHSFWRHPFTAEDPLVSKWFNAKFLQIFSFHYSLLLLMVPWRTCNTHGIFPFHKKFFIVENGSLDYYNLLYTKKKRLF